MKGIDNVAVESLPLQAVLRFEPSPRDQAIEYLSSLCSTLGIESEDPDGYVADLYDRSVVSSGCLLNKPGPPNGNEWLPHFDLRRSIMQLQLERGHQSTVGSGVVPGADLNHLAKQLDMMSGADAHLSPRSWAIMEVSLCNPEREVC
jgi:hypothetical protein